MKNFILISLFLVLAVVVVFKMVTKEDIFNSFMQHEWHHRFIITQAHALTGFNLIDPEQAPPSMRASVKRGYHLVMDTPRYAPNYAGDQLSCTNCHFAEGDTVGGKNNGISLVGVTTQYPRYSAREGKVITLSERIGNCFERSLNGKRPPEDSQEMQDVMHYLEWISADVKHLAQIPWLGLTFIQSQHKPHPENGAKVYQIYCAMCHKQNGEGGGVIDSLEGKTVPPIWGAHSFNDGAGMSHLDKLASFIYWNMPYNDANLTKEQALDVAAFVLQQPRPHFKQKEIDQ